jgi:hypothetical protein
MTRSSHALVAVLSVALALAVPVAGQAPVTSQLPTHPQIREAYLAWDRGDYPEALRGYLAALENAGAAAVRRIAGLTGETYRVTEVAPDGGNLTVAPDGRFATFEVTDSEGETESRVVELATGRVVASLAGVAAAPGPSGRVAYLALGSVPDAFDEAVAEANRALQAGDRRGYVTRMREAAWYRVSSLELRVYDVASGEDAPQALDDMVPGTLAWEVDGGLLVSGASRDGARGRLARVRDSGVEELGLPEGYPAELLPGADGTVVVAMRTTPVLPTPPGAEIVAQGMTGVAVVSSRGESAFFPGARAPSVAADGSVLAYLRVRERTTELQAVALTDGLVVTTIYATEDPVAAPAVSPNGAYVAFQGRPLHDWEIFAVATTGGGEPSQLSNEIQHDRYPRWVDERTVLAAKGEGRHMRSHLYDLDGEPPLKLFHNNTVRTIAPEYEWAVVPGGRQVLVVSERDGDTVSPERGVYLVHRDRPVERAELVARLQRELASEERLRTEGADTFEPIRAAVGAAVAEIQLERVYAYARDLYLMGSKHITQPGNRAAIEYLERTLRSWGYEPELQWFEPRPGIRTANVVVRIPGTVDRGLVYVVSTHFDSVERGPGADDNTSGTTALLEVARALRDRPMPATVELAFFTGEEAGLLGSREYVRRALEEGKTIAGALNNDMPGWANDHRLDNTIRYSNPGIRDIQHGAAILFSELITYDALYYKNTDAAAYYEAYGDIVGGIGSYPVLGNPHYHQATDRLETIDQRLVTEVARTTAASIMLLASAPSRLANAAVHHEADATVVSWDAAVESDVVEYRVVWSDLAGGGGERVVLASAVARVSVRLPRVPAGATVFVKAVNDRGHESWDWARVEVGAG